MRYAFMILAALALTGCDRDGERRSYELRYISPEVAANALHRPENEAIRDVLVTFGPSSPVITLHGEPEQLDRVTEMLRTIDRPQVVRFRFQIVEADGFTTTDSAIADVEAALRDLFRFRGYRLAAEAVAQGEATGHIQQQVMLADGTPLRISADITRVVSGESEAAVSLTIDLAIRGESILSTSLTVPSGKTAVVGSAQASSDRGTLILVVRPEIQ